MRIAEPRERVLPNVGVAATCIAAGVTLGLVSRFWDRLDSQIAWVLNIGGPWLVLAFLFGVWVRRPRSGAIGGAVMLVVAVGVYYALASTFHAAREVEAAVRITALWSIVGAVGGAAMGWAGAAWRSLTGPIRAWAVALLSGALLGEGVLLFLRPGRDGAKIFFLQIAAGALLPVVLLRSKEDRFRCILMTAALALGAVVAVVFIRAAARASFVIIPPT